jgi:hypothetical protein
MAWFRRSGKQDATREAERVAREANEMLDPYAERAMVVEGDRVAVDPAQLLQNIHDRMERVNLDPDTAWSAEEIMSVDETAVMFKQLGMGEIVVTETAWYARQVLARWPAELVEHQMPPQARIDMFLEGPKVDPADGDLGRQVINRALGSSDHVDTHPELDGLDADKLMAVWLAVVFWFCIKSGMLNKWDRGELPE